MISAKIVKDSVTEQGARLTTFQLRYHRFIHSEMMTHRVFSRNASSSRAIPIQKQIKAVLKDMAIPIHWGANRSGMQADKEIGKTKRFVAETTWKLAGLCACLFAYLLYKIGCHKQLANRVLEPFSYISVVVSATEWANFFALRYHHMAQPEIQQLAKFMYEAYAQSQPKLLKQGEWHLPYVEEHEMKDISQAIKSSVARCARVSYNNHDGTKPSIENDLKLYNRLLGHQPIHASPAEHQATPSKSGSRRSGNFIGWKQYRKGLKGENITSFTKEV